MSLAARHARASRWPLPLIACLSMTARADDATSAAREAYDHGARAFEAGDFDEAALYLARADELVPNDVALTSAIRAAILADRPELGMHLVKRATERPVRSSELQAAVTSAEARFRGRTTELFIDCGVCTATLDGVPIAVGRPVFVRSGSRDLVLERGQRRRRQRVELVPGEGAKIDDVDPLSEPPPPPSSEPSAYSLIGGGLTVLLGVAAVASGVDTERKHTAFVAGGCPGYATASCLYAAEDGQAAETRTNVLLVTTAVSAVATLVAYAIGAAE